MRSNAELPISIPISILVGAGDYKAGHDGFWNE